MRLTHDFSLVIFNHAPLMKLQAKEQGSINKNIYDAMISPTVCPTESEADQQCHGFGPGQLGESEGRTSIAWGQSGGGNLPLPLPLPLPTRLSHFYYLFICV